MKLGKDDGSKFGEMVKGGMRSVLGKGKDRSEEKK